MVMKSIILSIFRFDGVIFFLLFQKCHAALLHEDCIRNSDCRVDLSHCSEATNKCSCRPYTVEFNSTTCLPGKLLGFECQTDAQCTVKVQNSGCANGACICGDGFVRYRRHSCLRPAKFGEICFDNDQCALGLQGSECKFVVPKVFGRCHCGSGKEHDIIKQRCVSKGARIGQSCSGESDCSVPNSYCHRKMDGNSVCTCEISFFPSSDGQRCLQTYRGLLSATTLGYPCDYNLQCQLADPNSICHEGICNCIHPNSTCNAANTGCHRSTFQCHGEAKCISYYFLCDGKNDCSDGSDELCDVVEQCPRQAFQCPGKSISSTVDGRNNTHFKCISKANVCDGKWDCRDGEDEIGCSGKESCPPGTFQCATTKECLPEHQFCNSIANCKDFSDENAQECRLEFQPSEFCPFRCSNGLCRSSAVVCSGVNGCGDNSDENLCNVCRCPRVS